MLTYFLFKAIETEDVHIVTRLLILEISADVANHVFKIEYVRDRVAHMKATRQRDFDYYIRLTITSVVRPAPHKVCRTFQACQ